MDKLSTTTKSEASPALVRLRVATTVFFALGGFVFAGWAVRIPAIKDQVAATPGTLGLALFAMTGSAVATMAVTGRLCERFGSRRVAVVASALLALSAVPPTLTRSALALGLALLLFGVAYGAIDVAINSVAVDLVAALRRPVMPSLHAANSLGSLAGAGLGGVLAGHLSPTGHMLLMVPVVLAATAAGGWFLLTRPLPAAHHEQAPVDRPRRLLPRAGTALPLFALIALCAAYSQGALDSWVPLHITDDLGGGQGVAAAGYAIVQGTMTIGRLSGVALLERLGQTRVVVVGGAVASAGALVAALAPDLGVVLVALAATGLGLANIFPVAIARAGALGGPNGVAFASTLGYGGILLAPPTIGFLANGFGLPLAFTLIAVMVGAAAVTGYAVRNSAAG
ncbi:MFS family permease [Saccharothrix coeruleofusca]|uniref:MFS transporter n=1 Tax=Saccharothrix coeruleofusca TaxID=33919 RepID=UPI001AE3ED76|nr:MFS transporter [Saccharothrix coeruleofusca]MBP2336089.1 MFS family permease [Saccharothrix coeruleofusca]